MFQVDTGVPYGLHPLPILHDLEVLEGKPTGVSPCPERKLSLAVLCNQLAVLLLLLWHVVKGALFGTLRESEREVRGA